MSKESRKFHVPDELANLYDFANTLDLRHFVHHGVQHRQAEELGTPSALGAWMKERGLFEPSGVPSQKTFDSALRLRNAIRGYLKCDPEQRRRKTAIIEALNKAMEPFSLRVAGSGKGGMKLLPAEANAPAGLSAIVAELYDGASNGTLDRLKMCAADECQRVFFDRSKPGSRRWCQTELCGNREKTRNYRERQKKEAESES
jgi:predicted RNA-binding Zn ribbon-like protein